MRPAVWRFGAVLLASSCWHDTPATTAPVANHVDTSAAADLTGSYWCSIREDTYNYPPFPCAITRDNADYTLTKLAGSVRFRGRIVPDAHHGFSFAGQLFCPMGDCTAALHGVFTQSRRRGELVGHFRDDPMVVTLVPMSPNAFGGAAYGGTDYDDGCDDTCAGAFGGGGYGGATYATDPFNARH